MSRTLNKVMLIGNVGTDPILKHTPSGIPVISFRLATSESWKNRDGSTKEHTDWHTIIAWRGLAEIINKILSKGNRIYIEGKLQSRSFEKNGQKRHVVEVLAENMLLLDGNKKIKIDDENFSENTYAGTPEYSDSYVDDMFDFDLNESSDNNSNDIPF